MALSALGAGGLALAGRTAQAQPAKPAELKAGIATYLSGPASVFGVPGRQTAEMLIEEVNAASGIGGVQGPADLRGRRPRGGPRRRRVSPARAGRGHVGDPVGHLVGGLHRLRAAGRRDEAPDPAVGPRHPAHLRGQPLPDAFRPQANATPEILAALLYFPKAKPDFRTLAVINQDYAWGRDSWDTFRTAAGKTTTLRALMGLLPLDAGRVAVDGRDCAAVPAHHRARLGIGYAPEERRLFGAFTVEANIRLPAEVLRLPRAEVSRRLDAVYAVLPELRTLAARPAAGLSGGQGKMVALGRALMVGTRAVLLDEPFQGLAPALALRYAEALAGLRAALPDVAILVTESSPDLLAPLVDTTRVIERGEILPPAPSPSPSGRGPG